MIATRDHHTEQRRIAIDALAGKIDDQDDEREVRAGRIGMAAIVAILVALYFATH